jgi:hypothetical protein
MTTLKKDSALAPIIFPVDPHDEKKSAKRGK